MSSAFVKFQPFVEAMAEKKHNLGSDELKVFLSNVAPSVTYATLSQITEISYTNLSTRVLTVTASAQTGGVYKLTITDLVLTAGGGAVATFRYVGIYNNTAANDELIGYYDYGAGGVTLADTQTLTLDFDGTNGVLQVA